VWQGWMGGWVCGCVGVWVGVWVCGRVGVGAGVWVGGRTSEGVEGGEGAWPRRHAAAPAALPPLAPQNSRAAVERPHTSRERLGRAVAGAARMTRRLHPSRRRAAAPSPWRHPIGTLLRIHPPTHLTHSSLRHFISLLTHTAPSRPHPM
jgi:hypothetical protein